MASARLQDWLDRSLVNITHEKFKGCVKAKVQQIKPLTDQAIVIASEIFRVEINLEYGSGKSWSFKVIAKLEPTDDGFGKFVRERGFFDTEIQVYMKTLKHMEQLKPCDNSKGELAPECYHAAEGVLLLQDCGDKGYKIVSTDKLLTLEHIGLAVKKLAEFHAKSLVMKEKGTLLQQSFKPIIYEDKENAMVVTMSSALCSIAEFIKSEWGPEWSTTPDRLMKLTSNLGDKLSKLVKKLQVKCQVLCHGDFTMRNMLFKVDKSGHPTAVQFIDFQGTCWANPIFDLITLLDSSIIPQQKDEHLTSVLLLYTESLREVCLANGYGGLVPALQDIQEWYEEASICGAVTALFALPIFLADHTEPAVDQSDNSQAGSVELLSKSYLKSKKTEQNLKYVIQRCIDKNII